MVAGHLQEKKVTSTWYLPTGTMKVNEKANGYLQGYPLKVIRRRLRIFSKRQEKTSNLTCQFQWR